MSEPQRAARLWVAGAVATLWLLSVGGEADASIPVGPLPPLPPHLLPSPRHHRAPRLRLVSVFRQGWTRLLVALLQGRRLPTGRFVPEPWPSTEDKKFNLPVMHEGPLAA